MVKEVLFLILDNYADWESAYLSTAITELSQNTISVKTLSLSKKPIKTMGGFHTLPDYAIDEVPKNFDALFLIGSNSWYKESAKEILPLIEKVFQQDKVIGAICAASEFLAAQGFLHSVKHTSNGISSIEKWPDAQYHDNGNYINEQAVRDNNVITANGTGTLEFARECLFALNIADEKNITEWYNFMKIGYCNMMKSDF